MQIKKLILAIITVLSIVMIPQPVFALDDGAYLIGRSTSYVNPLTGSTEDGGTNITLGESMVSSIVESQLLLEQVNGKYYITIGLGLASNVSNVRFKIMDSNGTFTSVNATKTGSSSANGDTVNHYRIQVSSLNVYISPILYVTPMGRDVQFFIKLDTSSATAGTGIYTSLMVPTQSQSSSQSNQSNNDSSTTQKSQTADNQSLQTTSNTNETSESTESSQSTNTTVGAITKESLMENVTGLSYYIIDENGQADQNKELTVENLKNTHSQSDAKTSQNNTPFIIGGIVLIIVVAGGFYYVKKIKK